MIAQGGTVANDDKLFAGTRHGHIHAADVGKKANGAGIIATSEADVHHIALLPLKRIDGIDRQGTRLHQIASFEQFAKQVGLGFVGRNNSPRHLIQCHTVEAHQIGILGEMAHQQCGLFGVVDAGRMVQLNFGEATTGRVDEFEGGIFVKHNMLSHLRNGL